EAWNLPSGAVFVEISQKARVATASRVHDELLVRLDRAGGRLWCHQCARVANKLRLLARERVPQYRLSARGGDAGPGCGGARAPAAHARADAYAAHARPTRTRAGAGDASRAD